MTTDTVDWGRMEDALQQLATEYGVESDTARLDGVYNAHSGLGVLGTDRHEDTVPATGHRRMTPEELDEQLEHSRFARRLIESAPNDCVRAGWRFQVADNDRNDPVASDFTRLGVKNTLWEAHYLALLTGGAGVVVVSDDAAAIDEPIDLSTLNRVKALHVFDAEELKPEIGPNQMLDSERGSFDEPTTYNLTPHSGVGMHANTFRRKRVHASRVLRFEGAYVRRKRRHIYDGWGQPLIETLWKPLRDLETATQALASTIHEFKYGVLKVEDLKYLLTGPNGEDSPDRLIARMRVMLLTKSLIKALVLDAKNESYETREINFTGLDIAYGILQQNLSAVAHQSLTKLFGQAPKGFTSEDDTGQENWADHVSSEQERQYHPALVRLAELIMIGKEGELPRSYDIVFNPIRQQSDEEKAKTYSTVAAADEKYFGMGVLTEDEMHTRFERAEFGVDLVLEEDALASVGELDEMREEMTEDEVEATQPSIEPVPDDLVSQRTAAESMGVPTQTISALCRKGKLRFWQIGRHRQVSMTDVIQLGRSRAADIVQTDSPDGPRYMLAVRPPIEFIDRLVHEAVDVGIEATEPPHLTMVYLGRRPVTEDPELFVGQVVGTLGPIFDAWRDRPRLKVSGAGMFFNGPAKVANLLVDGVGLTELRTAVAIHLGAEGLLPYQQHGFQPHVTIRYFDGTEEIPEGWERLGAVDYPEWRVQRVCLIREDEIVHEWTIGEPPIE